MNLIITPHDVPCPFLKRVSQKTGRTKGIEIALSNQSRKVRFLDLLAQQRAKNGTVQFNGIDLSNFDLSCLDFCGVDFTGANFTNANLSGSNLTGANLTNATLNRTILTNANMTDVNLTNVVIDRLTQLAWQQVSNQRWFDAAQKSIPEFSQEWKRLKEVDGFNAFETMLKRINEWSLKNSVTTAEIVEVIDAVLKSDDICNLVFEVAQGADVKSHYHLLTIFNTAQCLAKFGKLLNADETHREILNLAKAMVRQNLLDDATLPVMRNQWSDGRRDCNGEGTGPNVSEALKVQLALRCELVTQLELPFAVKNPLITNDFAGLNESDKQFAIDFINKYMNEKEQLVRALVTLPIWQLYLEHVLREKLNALDNGEQISIDALLQQETERMLHPQH